MPWSTWRIAGRHCWSFCLSRPAWWCNIVWTLYASNLLHLLTPVSVTHTTTDHCSTTMAYWHQTADVTGLWRLFPWLSVDEAMTTTGTASISLKLCTIKTRSTMIDWANEAWRYAQTQRRSQQLPVSNIDYEETQLAMCIYLAANCILHCVSSEGFTSDSTHNRSFQRCSSQPISWLSTEEIKPNTTTANNKIL